LQGGAHAGSPGPHHHHIERPFSNSHLLIHL
jgi:hypothetical protein